MEKLYDWFDENREHIIKDNHGKIVLIHDNSVAGYYDDAGDDALNAAYDKGFVDGEYIIQECITRAEELSYNLYGMIEYV